GERHGAAAAQDFGILLVEETDLHLVLSDLRALALQAQHQVQAGVHRGELLHPDVLEDAEDRELPRLVHQRIVGDDRKVEMHAAPGAGMSTAATRSTVIGAPPRPRAARMSPAAFTRRTSGAASPIATVTESLPRRVTVAAAGASVASDNTGVT